MGELSPTIRRYLERVQLSAADSESRKTAIEQGAFWISQSLRRSRAVDLIVVCTGNSRRSVLGSVLGNCVADFYRLSGVRFFSGGTEPTACNPRTIKTLTEIGVNFSETGGEAERGVLNIPNPMYRVEWGSGEMNEFSKRYDHPYNPKRDFAALMVCTEADDSCPTISGAALRLSCPFVDPKEADGQAREEEEYRRRRDEICRFMLDLLRIRTIGS